jgi:hypothetical protein
MGRFTVRDAQRQQAKLRLMATSPSGGGKTFGSLLLAAGLGGKIVLIDTERGSSDKYDQRPDLPKFRVIPFDPPFTPEAYIEAIDAAEADGADVIIIDSTSHEWDGPGGCLELVDEIARAKFRGNTWSAWSELTPRHRKFIDRMLASRCHIIATARSKTETAQVDDGGRKKVVKLGMKSITRDGTEFEFDVVLDIVHDGHFAVASKDRTGVFSGDPKPITAETGRKLAEWLRGGTPPAPAPLKLSVPHKPGAVAARAMRSIERCDNPDEAARIRVKIDHRLAAGELGKEEAFALLEQLDARESEILNHMETA